MNRNAGIPLRLSGCTPIRPGRWPSAAGEVADSAEDALSSAAQVVGDCRVGVEDVIGVESGKDLDNARQRVVGAVKGAGGLVDGADTGGEGPGAGTDGVGGACTVRRRGDGPVPRRSSLLRRRRGRGPGRATNGAECGVRWVRVR